MRDVIHIKNLRLRSYIGFAEHELRDMQDVVINMWLYTDIRRAGTSDDPADLLNYRTVNKAVINQINGARYKTIEALATEVARIAIVDCGVEKLKVSVNKPGALRFTDDVGVIIKRTRKDFLSKKQARKQTTADDQAAAADPAPAEDGGDV